MANEWIPLVLSGGGLLTGIAAFSKVWLDSRTTSTTAKIDHSEMVLGGYGDLMDKLQHQVEVLSITVVKQGEEIESLKVSVRDRDDRMHLLTLDRDDLIAWLARYDGNLPALRTV